MSNKYDNGEGREEPYEYSASDDNVAKRSLKPVLIAGGGLLVAVIVVLMFLSSPKSTDKDQLKSIETRLKQIEEKFAKLEWIDSGMARLDRKEKDFAALAERMTQMESSMNRRIDQLGKEAVRPAAKQEPASAKTESAPIPRPEASPAKSAPASPKAEKDSKGKVHVVEKGETIYGISRRYGIPADQLFKLNHLSPKDPIRPGQKLALGPAKAN
ncbi:MAG: LysM peptidoglycan-binding domain-containing protein [Deltaproteobacteria bacterium]|nr:LysM peptidoglycan-binding domain-containing protein [Deltaproteobacteria bacterium]